MKALGNIIAFTLVLGFVAGIIYFMYQGTLLVWANIDVLAEGQRVILIAAVITALLFAVIMAWGMRSSAQMRNGGRLGERRHELYVHVLTAMRGLLDAENDDEQKEALAAELVGANADFMILGSSKCLKAYLAFKDSLDRGETELLPDCFQAVWKSMRKDLASNDDFDVFNINDVINLLPKVTIVPQSEQSQDLTDTETYRDTDKDLLPEG